MKHYYAKLWTHGRAITEVLTNLADGRCRVDSYNVVAIYRFSNTAARDAYVREYMPPSYCPSAFAEAVTSRDSDVRRAIEGGGLYEIREGESYPV